MPDCPICHTDTNAMLRETPYRVCRACGTAFQSLQESVNDFPKVPTSPHDRDVNRQLAQWLVANAMAGNPGRVLDIGCGDPVLAHSLAELGCDAIGVDIDPRAAKHGSALGVPTIIGDVLALGPDQIRGIGGGGRFRLITLVHVFDRFADPVAALHRLRELVADDGRVFLRLPDHAVAGSERFMQPGHFDVAPLLHTFSGLLELCVQTADQFSIERTYTLDGAGQRDVILRPLTRKPSVLAGMIVKNEERDLPRCLRSIEDVVDGVVLVDTGSTDRTIEVANTTIGKPVYVQTYTGASRQDEHGDWKLWDFAKARNVFVDEIDRRNADWVLWMDADDELLTPANLRRAFWWDQHDVYGVQIESAGQRWLHHRLWRANRGIRFAGRCHEYPTIGGHATLALVDSVIRHDATPGFGEGANARNLRILTEEFAEDPSPRVAFYLGSTHKDAGRWREAVSAYATRIAMGEAYRDEWLFAYLYKGRCERSAGEVEAAERTLLEALSRERTWAEYWMELAYISYDQRRWQQALGYALQAAALPVPPTMLWRELDKYNGEPARIASLCYEQMGEFPSALAQKEPAPLAMPAPDGSSDERTARLQNPSARPAQASTSQRTLAERDPGSTSMSKPDGRIAYRACPLCDNADIAEFKSASCAQHPLYRPSLPPVMRWMRCTHCEHVFTDGYWSAAALDDIFSSALPHQLPGNDPHGSRAIAARMVEKVMRRAKIEQGRWLDVGFGNGALLGAAEEYGFSVAGLDLRAQAVDLMRTDGIEAHVMELQDYRPELPPHVISLADVLEHIPFPIPALQAAHRMLAPEGALFVSMPNSDCYAWRMLDRLGNNPFWGELEHYHNFGKQRLHALLRQQGFEPIDYGISERYYLCMEVIARKVA